MLQAPTNLDAVLVVDHDAGVRDAIGRWLAGRSSVIGTGDAGEALSLLAEQPFAVALCEIALPGRDGFWLLEHVRRRAPETALILATGVQDVGSAVTSLRLGVIDYLMKPFGRDRLREAVRRGVEWHRQALAGRQDVTRLRAELCRRRDVLAAALHAVPIGSGAVLDATLALLMLKNPAMLEHARRVASLSRTLGLTWGLDHRRLDVLERAALVHDLPKLVVPDAILDKGGPLLPQELDVVRVAPSVGHALLLEVGYLVEAATVVRARHEWWDGAGYPRGLAGHAIPIESRVLAVADTFDTLVRPRRYRAAVDDEAAVVEIRRCRGTQFDPSVVDALEHVLDHHADGREELRRVAY